MRTADIEEEDTTENDEDICIREEQSQEKECVPEDTNVTLTQMRQPLKWFIQAVRGAAKIASSLFRTWGLSQRIIRQWLLTKIKYSTKEKYDIGNAQSWN